MKNKVLIQIIFWGLITGITLGVASTIMPVERAVFITMLNIGWYSVAFYTNVLYLFPRLYKDGNNKRYVLSVSILIVIVTCSLCFMEYFIVSSHGISPVRSDMPIVMMAARSFFWLALIVVVGTVYSIQKRLREQLIYHKQMQEEKLKTELNLLKSQINPHFLFNALNNIFSLSHMKSEKAPESILKLSSMLRYVIEECSTETVPLISEIEYIKNYIDFHRLKSPDEMNVIFDHSKADLNIRVAPMLFIPFLENSFKYSKIEEFQNAYINIEMKSVKKNQLIFTVANSVPPIAKARPGAGTGISNVKQRLHIIYPGMHRLNNEEKLDNYRVTLNIEIHEA